MTNHRSVLRIPCALAAAACFGLGANDLMAQLTLVPQATLNGSNTVAADSFGISAAVSGDTIVIGAPGEDSNATGVNGNQANNSALNSGAAYIFTRSGTNWTQQAYLKASNTGGDHDGDGYGDYFGISAAIFGDTVVVGAPWEASGGTGVDGDQTDNSASSSGAAYIYARSGTNWTQQAYLKASNSQANLYFGEDVAISGDTIIVSARTESTRGPYAGAAYVFVRDGTNWSEQAILHADNAEAGDYFGAQVDISGDTIVVSADSEDSSATGVNGDQSDNSMENTGAVYVFVRDGTTWTQQAYLKASNTGLQDYFGSSVAISGNTIVVGAGGEDSIATGVNGNQDDNSIFNAGAAYVFVREGTSWTQQAYIKKDSAPKRQDNFGGFRKSVALSGDTVMVGYGNWDTGNSAVHIFTREGTVWTQQAKLNGFWSGGSASGDTLVLNRYVFTGLLPPPPALAIQASNDGVRLSWPLSATDFVLEETSALATPPATSVWSPVSLPYETNAADISVTVTNATGSSFFRLRKP